MSTTEISAVRYRRGSKAVIAVTFPDGYVKELGGSRAARAEAVVVTRYGTQWGYGVRGSLLAAQQEAHRLATQTEMRLRHGRGTIPLVPPDESYALPVTDAAVTP